MAQADGLFGSVKDYYPGSLSQEGTELGSGTCL